MDSRWQKALVGDKRPPAEREGIRLVRSRIRSNDAVPHRRVDKKQPKPALQPRRPDALFHPAPLAWKRLAGHVNGCCHRRTARAIQNGPDSEWIIALAGWPRARNGAAGR